MAKRGTRRVLEYARLAMGLANVRAGTRVLMLVLVQALISSIRSLTNAYIELSQKQARMGYDLSEGGYFIGPSTSSCRRLFGSAA